MKYKSLDYVISLIFQLGRGALKAKADIEETFRVIPNTPFMLQSVRFYVGQSVFS